MFSINQRIGFLISFMCIFVLLLSPAGCIGQEKADKSKTIEDMNKEFMQVYTEDFWNTHNLAAINKYHSADFIMHSVSGDRNLEQYKQLCQEYFIAFPDLHITSDDLVAEGDKVAKRWTVTSTHKGKFMGIPATGNHIRVTGIEIFRIKDGKIVEVWVNMDNLGMMQQLGVIPGPEEKVQEEQKDN